MLLLSLSLISLLSFFFSMFLLLVFLLSFFPSSCFLHVKQVFLLVGCIILGKLLRLVDGRPWREWAGPPRKERKHVAGHGEKTRENKEKVRKKKRESEVSERSKMV